MRINIKWRSNESRHDNSQALLAGWDQFRKDLAEFKPVESKPEPKGIALLELPALVVQIDGQVKTSSLPAFRSTALAQIEAINTNLQTDQDFANAEAAVKHFTKAEKELEAAKKQAMAQTADIDALFRTIDQLKDTMRSKRLELDKLVKARKAAIKQEIIVEAQTSFNDHVSQINLRLPVAVPVMNPDFAGSIKGKKTVKSIREAVADTLASAKIEVTNFRKTIEENYDLLTKEINGRAYDFLFRDLSQILLMESGHLSLLVKDRIASHEQAEAARLEAERERIRLEQERKAQAEAARLAEIERQRIAEAEAVEEEQLTMAIPEPVQAEPTNLIQYKMNKLMYSLVKEAARSSFSEFLSDLGISDADYEAIKAEWLKIGITETYI